MSITKGTVVCLVSLLVAVAAYGQAGLGSISGRISDPSGAVVPDASVVVTNTDTGVRTELKSNAEGLYQALQLIPGPYAVDVEMKGFKKAHRVGIQVRVADRLTLDFTLEVGDTTETIEVLAEAPLLRTQDSQTGEVINRQFIENMPQLERDPMRLLVLSGNIQGDGTRAGRNLLTGEWSDTRINGGRTSGVEYFVDGITAGTGGAHSVIAGQLTPSMEGLGEFKVITNGISAEYGRISGGAVEMVTRSGTNEFHGQVFEYFKNDRLNANSWQQNSLGGKKTAFHNNDFGFSLGGPVWIPKVYRGKDRTFFFVNYEGTRFSQAGTLVTTSLPTAAEREGDFTNTMFDGVPTMMYDPDGPQIFNAELNKWERTLPLGGDGRHVPKSQIHPMIVAVLAKTPLPTPGYGRANSSSAENYVAPQNSYGTSDSFSVRMDHNFTTNHRLFARFQGGTYDGGQTRILPLWGAPETHLYPGRVGTVNYDWSISPTFLFNAKAGVNHNPLGSGHLMPADWNNEWMPWDPVTKRIIGDQGLPMLRSTFMGGTFLSAGVHVEGVATNIVANTTYHAGAAMTKILGRHTVKYGYEHRRYYDNYFTSTQGDVTFQQNPVARYAEDNDWNSQAYANSMGSMMLGIADWFWVHGPHSEAMNFNYHAAYVQDDFKVNSRLTLNLGVRWDVETPTTERNDKLYFWDPEAQSQFSINPGYDFTAALARAGLPTDLPAPAWVTQGFQPGAVRIANTPEFPSRKGQTVNPHQFTPRIGVAYQIDPKTVFRGAFGMMYLSSSGNPQALISGGSNIATYDSADAGWHASNDGLRHLISTFDNPYRPSDISTYQRDNRIANYQSTGSTGVGAWSRKSNMPYELTWNLGIQRELPQSFLVEANYSANRGVRLLAPDLISRFPKQLFVPDPDWVKAMKTMVDSPTAGQTREDAVVGTQQRLAFLYYPMPYYGPVNLLGVNQGSSMYHSLNLRLERRFRSGLSFLANYTLSRLMDDVGGPEAFNLGIVVTGNGGKAVQTVDGLGAAWGVGALDETHRLVLTYSYELPFGRGKQFLGSPDSLAKKLLDYAAGGWQFSGFTVYRSGRPVIFIAGNQNVNNDIRAEHTKGSYASSDHNLVFPGFTSNHDVLKSSQDPRTPDMMRAFDPSKVLDAQTFTYGTLPAVNPELRHPGNSQTDLSLMKKFRFDSEGKRFLQLRLEALNALNARGYGPYNTTIGSPDFGLITSVGHIERQMQVSARIVF